MSSHAPIPSARLKLFELTMRRSLLSFRFSSVKVILRGIFDSPYCGFGLRGNVQTHQIGREFSQRSANIYLIIVVGNHCIHHLGTGKSQKW